MKSSNDRTEKDDKVHRIIIGPAVNAIKFIGNLVYRERFKSVNFKAFLLLSVDIFLSYLI